MKRLGSRGLDHCRQRESYTDYRGTGAAGRRLYNRRQGMGDIKEEIRNENKQSANSSEQNFEFITETIKEKPINKRHRKPANALK